MGSTRKTQPSPPPGSNPEWGSHLPFSENVSSSENREVCSRGFFSGGNSCRLGLGGSTGDSNHPSSSFRKQTERLNGFSSTPANFQKKLDIQDGMPCPWIPKRRWIAHRVLILIVPQSSLMGKHESWRIGRVQICDVCGRLVSRHRRGGSDLLAKHQRWLRAFRANSGCL